MWKFVWRWLLQKLLLKKQWRYVLDAPYHKTHELLKNVYFSNEWVHIDGGTIIISARYAWDGCTPAYKVPLIKWWVGIPDGWGAKVDGKCQAYYASLVHDALCQFRQEIPISKDASVELFSLMLEEGGFPRPIARIYRAFVKVLGPQRWRGYRNQPA